MIEFEEYEEDEEVEYNDSYGFYNDDDGILCLSESINKAMRELAREWYGDA